MESKERYRILSKIGQGGKGEVFLAYDEKLAVYKVAKMIRRDTQRDFAQKKQEFISEILLMKDLHHPCLAHINDIVMEEESIMVIMDYIEGDNLENYIRKMGPQPEHRVIDWGIQLAELLLYLHERTPPVYHCDLKPSNIMYHISGRLILIDFGRPGEGTPGYAAPEQYRLDGNIDGRTDIYGLGRTLLYCLQGSLEKDFSNPVSSSMIPFLNKCIQQKPEERYQNVKQVLERLTVLQQGQMTRGKLRIRNKKLYLGLVFSLCFFLCFFWSVCGEEKEKKARFYVQCAVENMEKEKSLSYYEKALQLYPREKDIYRNLLQEYLAKYDFSRETVIEVLNVLERTRALLTLERAEPAYYGEFCYEMGIGYFYGMDGNQGKMDACVWFSRALEHSDDFSETKKRRGNAYKKIGEYYQGFLLRGENQSGEGKRQSYEDFFHILCQLNDCWRECDREVSEADQKAVYLASMEVVEEIYSHGNEFLEHGKISAEDLLNQLNQAENLSDDHSILLNVWEKGQIRRKVFRAKRRILVLEEMDEM